MFHSAQAILCSHKRPVVAPPAVTEEMIATAQQRVTSTIDELVDNKDYKVISTLLNNFIALFGSKILR